MTRVLLWLASWIAPAEDRDDWLAEWRAELWHVQRAGARPVPFCLGAFRDALWLRLHADPKPRASLIASPVRCLLVLAAIAGAALLCPSAPQLPGDVVELRPHGRALVTVEQYRDLLAETPSRFLAIAFYRRSGDTVIATPAIHQVLRGAPLPDGRSYLVLDDPGPGSGRVLARLSTVQPSPLWIYSKSRGRERFDCVRIGPGRPVATTLLVFALGIVVLPAVTRFRLSGLSAARSWMFLAAKLALALVATCFAMQAVGPHMRYQAWIVGILLAFQWSFRDQQRRCPVCLQRLARPITFGCLSHTLLEWHGSEFICPRGHGLLQVTATPASPYTPQQWLRL